MSPKSSTRVLCTILARISSHYTLVVELIRGWEEEGKNIESHAELLNLALCIYIYIHKEFVCRIVKEKKKESCSMRNIGGCNEGKKRWMKFSGMAKLELTS